MARGSDWAGMAAAKQRRSKVGKSGEELREMGSRGVATGARARQEYAEVADHLEELADQGHR